MSTQQKPPLTPSQRIELVQKDRARRYGQIVLTFILIVFSIGFVTWYAIEKADANFLAYMATGMLAVLFAGIGAAYSIMGLGRTVGSTNNTNNDTILLMLESIMSQQKNTPEIPPLNDEFFEDNREDDLEADQPKETPVERPGIVKIDAVGVAPEQLQFLADKNTWHNELKTINGKPVVLVATQLSRRNKRTVYVYHLVGTNLIVFNRSRYGIFFMRIAYRVQNMQNFFDTFVSPPHTQEEKSWLERNDYVLT